MRMHTSGDRLMYRVFMWDRHLNESEQIKTWSHEIKSILYENNLNYIFDQQQLFPIKESNPTESFFLQ